MQAEIERAAQVLGRARRVMLAAFRQARLERPVDPDTCWPVVDDIAASLARHPSAFVSLARLKGRDDYVYMHALAVCGLMVGVGRQLGLDDTAVREAGLAGLLHDIGKARVPLDILHKPGRLSDSEMAHMRQHPHLGLRLVRPGAPAAVAEAILQHHEKLDGTGYPHHLQGPAIGRIGRMAAVCDVYDALTSRRPYKTALDPAQALQWMASWPGHFDPAVLRALVCSVGVYPTGSLVRLESGRLAVVIEQSGPALGRPVVKVFFSTRSAMPVPTHLLDLSEAGSGDAIRGREPLERWGFSHLEELWNPLSRRRS